MIHYFFRLSQTPLKLHVDIWCVWSFKDLEQLSNPIHVEYDISCCQGLAIHESGNDSGMHYTLEVRVNAVGRPFPGCFNYFRVQTYPAIPYVLMAHSPDRVRFERSSEVCEQPQNTL